MKVKIACPLCSTINEVKELLIVIWKKDKFVNLEWKCKDCKRENHIVLKAETIGEWIPA